MPEDEALPEVAARHKFCEAVFNTLNNFSFQKSHQAMSNMEQDSWSRVKGRLRTSVGEDVYTSWFARMDLESVEQESVRLSVPTRFLKSWIQAEYAERVLTCCEAELPQVPRIDVTVRTAMRCAPPVKEAQAPLDARRA